MTPTEIDAANTKQEEKLDFLARKCSTKKRKSALRIDETVIDNMAQLCARSLNESEACSQVGIESNAWRHYKIRHAWAKRLFDKRLEKHRAKKISQMIDRVERSANGLDIKQPDFRAALAFLKIIDRERYGEGMTQCGVTNNSNAVVIACGGEDGLRRVIESAFGIKSIKGINGQDDEDEDEDEGGHPAQS